MSSINKEKKCEHKIKKWCTTESCDGVEYEHGLHCSSCNYAIPDKSTPEGGKCNCHETPNQVCDICQKVDGAMVDAECRDRFTFTPPPASDWEGGVDLQTLIEQCGDRFRWLENFAHKGVQRENKWLAQARGEKYENPDGSIRSEKDVIARGKTPTEAVRNLLSTLTSKREGGKE